MSVKSGSCWKEEAFLNEREKAFVVARFIALSNNTDNCNKAR